MKKTISLLLVLIMSFSCFSLVSFAETTKTAEHLTEVPEGYIGVYTVEDLYFVRNDLTANYILMNDIDLSEATAEGGEWNYGGRGWNPIGSNDIYSNGAFSGVFEGNNYSITGLNIDIDSYPVGTGNNVYVGLFANVSGTVRNLTVEGRITTERTKTYSYSGYADHCFGGIAAYSDRGTIQNCTNKVNIYVYSPHDASYTTNSSVCLHVHVGGVLGYSFGATIENCANFADLNLKVESQYTVYAYCAGIVAYGKSTRCINSGNITAINCGASVRSDATYVYAYGIAREGASYCFNTGNIVSKEEEVNKYIGYSFARGISGYAAQNCYNVGKIEGITLSNAISNDTDTKNCYYLEGSGQGSTGATSLTEAQMKLQGMYAGWDFDTIWTMEGREDYPYPELRDVPLILPEDLNHKHEYTSEITTPATHLKEGVETFTCKCGDSYTEPVTKLVEHTYTSEVTEEATHLAEGETTYTCECGDTYTEVIAKLTAHTYDKTVTEPTCTEKGYTIYTCECGDTYTEEIAAVGHKELVIPSVEATCTGEGLSAGKVCEACGEELTSQQIIPANGHKFSSWIVISEVTCDTNGRKVRICACGAVEEDIENSFGHSDADNDNKCDSCNEALKTEVNMPAEKDNVFTFLKSFLNNLIEFFRQLLGIKK